MDRIEPKILHFESLPSTNDEAARLAIEGANEGLAVVADEQTAGRGRLHRTWSSPRGAGVYLSLLLRPGLPLDQWTLVTFAVAVAVKETLQNDCGVEADIKWPNDILAGERKICGILAESIETPKGRALILGVGVNLKREGISEALRTTAVSLEELTDKPIDRTSFVTSLLKQIAGWYEVLHGRSGGALIAKAWEQRSSYAFEKLISVSDGNEVFEGTTAGIESDGALRVTTPSGELRIVRAGDVASVRSLSVSL